MAISLADSYYLKALDLYPFQLERVTEALNYAISYDHEHAGANCLLGILNMYYLNNYSEAENHFEKALSSDLNHTDTYYSFSELLIQMGEYDRAKKLIKHAYKIKGISVTRLKHQEGVIAEIKGELSKAKEFVTFAYDSSFRKYEREFLKEELDRIKSKIKEIKKAGSKKSGSKALSSK